MIRLMFVLLTLLSLSVLPVWSQDAQRMEKLLYDSAASFKQDNYFLGVSQVIQACGMLRHNPSAAPDDNYINIATTCLDSVNTSIRDAQARGDVPTVTRRVYALQPLIQSLIDWDSANPRWHYEKGMLFRVQSTSMKDQYPAILEQAVAEFTKALTIGSGGSYRNEARKQLSTCQQIIQRRSAEIVEFRRTHPQRNNTSQPSAPYQPPEPQTYCPKCGGSHGYGVCIYTHGG